MVKRVIWSKRALKHVYQIIFYFNTELSRQAAENFKNNIDGQLNWLIKNPTKGRLAKRTKTIRFVNIDKHRQMFYRLEGASLHIVAFWDTLQDPRKRPF
jgi:plasmid stabilization system protein ParE